MRVTKKPSGRVIFFFAVSRVSRLTRLTAKKKLHDLTVFLLHAFTAKKTNYTTYSKKKITRPNFFLLHAFTAGKKNTRLTPKKKITRPDGFLLHAFTAKKKGGRGYVATLPTCGPLLILPPALKRRGPPRRQGLCSHVAHLWATSDSAACSEAVGTP